MKKLNVAVIVPIFPNIVQTYILSQIVALKKSDINTIIVAVKRGKYEKLPPAISEYNILDDTIYINAEYSKILQEFFSLPLQNKLYKKALKIIIKSRSWKKYGIKYFIKELIRLKVIAHHTIDIIHSHSLFTSYDYLFLKEHFSIPIVTTYHGMVPKGVKQLDNDKQKILFEEGDLFIVNTEFAKHQLIDLGCPQEKINIIPQGTNLSDFPVKTRKIDPQSKIILLTVGRLSIEKGHHIAIQAIANLADSSPNLEYNIVGEGPEKANLNALIDKLKLKSKVKLHGMVTSEELKSFYSKAHIFVLPSIDLHDGYHVETQGVVIQEAQSSGIPVIASKTGGIPEVIIHSETGFLFEENNHLDLSDKIKQLVQDPALYHRISLAGRKDVEKRFSMAVLCNKLIYTYKTLLKNKLQS